MQPFYRKCLRRRWREEKKQKREAWSSTVFSEKVGWKQVSVWKKKGGRGCRHHRREGERDWRHGGGFGLVHCQLSHWSSATVAGSNVFSQITDAAQWSMPCSKAAVFLMPPILLSFFLSSTSRCCPQKGLVCFLFLLIEPVSLSHTDPTRSISGNNCYQML